MGKKRAVLYRLDWDDSFYADMQRGIGFQITEPVVINFDGTKDRTLYGARSPLYGSTYGSEEYKNFLKEMNVALQHHYANYRHHPEHFEKGINDMNLIDIVEMLCDWKASSMRQHDGNLLKSIEINAQRFGYNGQLKQILINTAKLFDEQN